SLACNRRTFTPWHHRSDNTARRHLGPHSDHDSETLKLALARRAEPTPRAAGAKIAQPKHFLLLPSGLNPFFTLNLKKSIGRQTDRAVPWIHDQRRPCGFAFGG